MFGNLFAKKVPPDELVKARSPAFPTAMYELTCALRRVCCGSSVHVLWRFATLILARPTEWRTKIRAEGHLVDREIRALERTEERTKIEIKKLAKIGELNSAKMLAKEIAQARKAKTRMYETKARLNSIVMQLSEQLATIKMTQAISASTEAMTAMNQLINVPVLSATMRTLGREMEKAGFIQEMMDDTLNQDDVSDEADEEIEKVFEELTAGVKLPSAAQKAGSAAKEDPKKVAAQSVAH